MSLEHVANVLIDEAIRMEDMARRLEQLIPAVRQRSVEGIARRAVNIADYGGSPELFNTAGADEATARFEQARRRLVAVLEEPEHASDP